MAKLSEPVVHHSDDGAEWIFHQVGSARLPASSGERQAEFWRVFAPGRSPEDVKAAAAVALRPQEEWHIDLEPATEGECLFDVTLTRATED